VPITAARIGDAVSATAKRNEDLSTVALHHETSVPVSEEFPMSFKTNKIGLHKNALLASLGRGSHTEK
jgi:hypothetical protein